VWEASASSCSAGLFIGVGTPAVRVRRARRGLWPWRPWRTLTPMCEERGEPVIRPGSQCECPLTSGFTALVPLAVPASHAASTGTDPRWWMRP
jgi:hypothetical protein